MSSACASAKAPGDEAIRRSILARVSEDTGLVGLDLGVTVTDGLVHLWGQVETVACRTAAAHHRRGHSRWQQLLVMGGFGHSRMRDFVLGGATKDVLNDLRIPVLLSH